MNMQNKAEQLNLKQANQRDHLKQVNAALKEKQSVTSASRIRRDDNNQSNEADFIYAFISKKTAENRMLFSAGSTTTLRNASIN